MCEVINLYSSETTCKNPPNFPVTVYAAIGGLSFHEKPIICGGNQDGGFYSSSCYSLENNEWISSEAMNIIRAEAAAAQLQNGNLLVTGGSKDSGNLNSAEMLTEEGWESKVPDLPVTIFGHCMVTFNSTTVMAIGGYQNDEVSRKTFFFTVGEESWTEGPELKYETSYHSCGRIRRAKESQEMSIIVAGGSDGSSPRSSVQILHEGSNEWQTGPDLPFGIYWSQMVEDQNGGVVLIGGFSFEMSLINILFQLPHGGLDAVWTNMETKLQSGRRQHIAFLVPDSSVDCF